MIKKVFAYLIGLVGLCLYAEAQTPPDTVYPYYVLKPIIVTAPRVSEHLIDAPWSADILEPGDINFARATTSLSEALDLLPGITISDRYNPSQGDRITSRGVGARAPFGVRGIRIFLDGIPLTMPDGTSQLNNLDLAWAKRIEIIRGPNASLYGNSAGGVININTFPMVLKGLGVYPRVVSGDFGFLKTNLSSRGRWNNVAYTFGLSRTKSDGFRQHSSAEFRNANLVLRIPAGKDRLTFVINAYDSPYALNPSSLDKATADTFPEYARSFIVKRGAGKKIRQLQTGLTYTRTLDNGGIKATAYYITRYGPIAIPSRIIKLDRSAYGFRSVFYKNLLPFGKQTKIIAGLDAEFQNDLRREFQNLGLPSDRVSELSGSAIFDNLQYGDTLLNQREQVLGLGPFIKLETSPVEKLKLHAGLRYDRYQFEVKDYLVTENNPDESDKRVMTELSPSLGVSFILSPSMTAYANYSTAFLTPTVNELSNRPTGEGGFNPDLKPEHLKNIEVGLKGLADAYRVFYSLSLYRMQIIDMLIPYQVAGTEEDFYRNAGRTRNLGFEAEFLWKPFRFLRVGASYTAMDFEFEDFVVEIDSAVYKQLAGNDVPGIPQHRLALRLSLYPINGLFVEFEANRVGPYYANDFNGPKPGIDKPISDYINDGYTVFNLRTALWKKFSHFRLELFGGVQNLTDVRYNGSVVPNAFGDRFFEPSPGRNFYWGVRIPLTW